MGKEKKNKERRLKKKNGNWDMIRIELLLSTDVFA